MSGKGTVDDRKITAKNVDTAAISIIRERGIFHSYLAINNFYATHWII